MSAARLALPLRIAIAAGLTPIVDKFITKPYILKETPTSTQSSKSSATKTIPASEINKAVIMKTPTIDSSNTNKSYSPQAWIARKLKEIRNRRGSNVKSL